jgi:hypothetical protein
MRLDLVKSSSATACLLLAGLLAQPLSAEAAKRIKVDIEPGVVAAKATAKAAPAAQPSADESTPNLISPQVVRPGAKPAARSAATPPVPVNTDDDVEVVTCIAGCYR